jgi:hypothetical protein
MRRVIVIAAASLGLAGCSSFSSFSLDSFKSPPPTVNVQLDSNPPGAEARTSLGPSCKTPCSVPVSTEGGFSVAFTLNKYLPMTIPVNVTRNPGDFSTPASTTIDPNPVMAELQPAKPPPRHVVKKMVKKKKPAPTPATAQPDTSSPFPPPTSAPPPPPAAPAR